MWHNFGTDDSAVATKNLVAAFERATKRALRLVEMPAHAGVLRSLAGEEECDLGPAHGKLLPSNQAFDGSSRRSSTQLFAELLRG